jgi:hypothetical protein
MEFIDQYLAQPDASAAKQQALAGIASLVRGTRQMPASLGAAGDIARMRKFFPSSEDEGRARMMTTLKTVGGLGLGLGALSGLARYGGAALSAGSQAGDDEQYPVVPNREVYVPIGKAAADKQEKEASALGILGGAAGTGAGLAAYGPSAAAATGLEPMKWLSDKARGLGKYTGELFTKTENPATHPLVWPIATALGVAGIYGGSKITSALLEGMRKRRMARELSSAKTEFQDSLRAQYDANKSASAEPCTINDAIDALAQAYASGELQKQSDTLDQPTGAPLDETDPYKARGAHVGVGNMGLGGALAIMTLLGLGGVAGGYAFGKSRDEPQRRAAMMRRATRRRQLATPPQFIARYEGGE